MPRAPRIRKSLRVELAFLQAVAGRCPENPWVLRPLGDLYTRTGRIEEGLDLDLRLTRLVPGDPLVWYNLACSYALRGETEEALGALSRAAHLGYGDACWMLQDADLKSLHGEPRFHELAERIQSPTGTAGNR